MASVWDNLEEVQPTNDIWADVEEVKTQPTKQPVQQKPIAQPKQQEIIEQPTPMLTGGIEQKVIQNWDSKGRVYYTDEQGNRIKSNVPLSRKIGNKIKATATNIGDWLTTDVGENAKQRRKAVAMGVITLADLALNQGRGLLSHVVGGGLGSGLYSLVDQAIEGKFNPKQLAIDTGLGAGLGAGGKLLIDKAIQPIAKNIARRTNIAKRRATPIADKVEPQSTLAVEEVTEAIEPRASQEVLEQPIQQVDEVVESVPQQTEQPKVNLNTLKSNIRANKFKQGNLKDYMVVNKGKKGYKSTIADPISYDIEKSQREFNNIITEISKNPEKLNDSAYMADLENRVQQIVDKTPYGNEAEVATPYWEKFWKAVDDGYNYNEFKLNRGKKAPQQLDDVVPEQVTSDFNNTETDFIEQAKKQILENNLPSYDDAYIYSDNGHGYLRNQIESMRDVNDKYTKLLKNLEEQKNSYLKKAKSEKRIKEINDAYNQRVKEANDSFENSQQNIIKNIDNYKKEIDVIPEQVVEDTAKTKERGFVDTVRQNYGDDVAKQITDKEYDVYSHEMQKANWENRTPEQKIQALNEVDNINPDVLYGKAQALNQAIQNGEPLNAAMLDGIAKNLTKAGQEIEAAKHFIPTSPEGIVLETIKQTRKNTPKQVLKLKDETSQIVDEVNNVLKPNSKTDKSVDMSNEEANAKFEVWLNTQIEKVKQKPVYGEKLDMLKAMENYRVQKANRALKASEKRMAREEFLNTDYSNEEAEARFLHSLSKDKRPPKAKPTRGTKEDLLKGMERYRQKEIKRLEREERQAISKLKKQELAKQKALEKEELDAIKALKREEEKRLKAIENILAKRVVKPAERKSLATQLLALNDNNGLTPENFTRLVDKHYGIQTIDVSDYAKIQELSERFINAKTDRERDVANGLIKKFIWNKQPKKWADKDRTFRNMNMLLSLPSRLLDVTSTTAFQGINALDELVAKGIDKVMGTGLRGKMSTPAEWWKSVARGAKEGAEDVNLGINTARSGEVDRYELGFHPQFENVPILGGAEKALNATIRIPDRMFYEARFDSALKDLMSTGKFTAEEAEEIAKNEALQAVFQGQGLLSKSSKFVRDLLNGRIDNKPMFDNETVQNIADNIQLGNRIAPFVQTPANLIAEGLERSPLGLVKGGFEMATAKTPQQLRQAQQTLAKGITGTTGATLGGGYLLNQVPNTIGGFTNEDLYGDDVTGLPPQSIVIGDKAVSLASMPFLTIPAGFGKALLEPNKTMPERLLNATTYTGNILSDLPMLKGLGDLYKGGVDIAKVGADYALGRTDLAEVGQTVGRVAGQQGANILSQYIPFSGTLGTIRNAADPYNREMMTYNENPLLGTAEYIGNRLQNRIPFASSLLPMKYNVLGEPSMRTNIENPIARTLEATISPIRIRNYTERPAEMEEMQRIQDYAMENDITGKTTLKFAKPKRYIGRGKDKTRLTNEQYSELTRLYNGKVYDELQFLMNTPEYQSADEETQIKWVREVMKEKKQEAEQEISDIIK